MIVFSANRDLEALDSEVTKRAVIIHIDASIPRQASITDTITRRVQEQMTGALYAAYLRAMIPQVGDMLDRLTAHPDETPDLLKASAYVLHQTLVQALGTVPLWCQPVTLQHYIQLGDAKIHERLRIMWRTNPSMFTIDRKQNQLILRLPTSTDMAHMRKDIPDTLLTSTAGDRVILNLRETETFLGMTFRRRLWFGR